jgi:hypothetical protein
MDGWISSWALLFETSGNLDRRSEIFDCGFVELFLASGIFDPGCIDKLNFDARLTYVRPTMPPVGPVKPWLESEADFQRTGENKKNST